MTTNQADLKLIQRYYDAFNRRDFAAYASLFHEDCEIVAPGVEARGIEAMRGFDAVWTGAFPDGKVTPVAQAETDGHVLSENRFSGTHRGPLRSPQGEVPATGRYFDRLYVGVFTVQGGKIKSQHVHYDGVTVEKDLGLRP
jgi:steroid delta-isomerase-like uncharacterized protein